MDVSERVRALAAVAREVGAVRVRHGDLELELGALPSARGDDEETPKATPHALRSKVLFPGGRVRLPVGS